MQIDRDSGVEEPLDDLALAGSTGSQVGADDFLDLRERIAPFTSEAFKVSKGGSLVD